MTLGECFENKWFYMKYMGKYLSVEILLTCGCSWSYIIFNRIAMKLHSAYILKKSLLKINVYITMNMFMYCSYFIYVIALLKQSYKLIISMYFLNNSVKSVIFAGFKF